MEDNDHMSGEDDCGGWCKFETDYRDCNGLQRFTSVMDYLSPAEETFVRSSKETSSH